MAGTTGTSLTVKHESKRAGRRKGRRRHVPRRTCVACRTVNPKRELVRVVRTIEGGIEIDPGGKQAGRGAYLCRRKGCWEAALKRRSLDYALKTKIDDATQARLAAYAAELPVLPEGSASSEG